SLPLRVTQGKDLSGLAPNRKVVSCQKLAHDSPVESTARQGNGREARKPPDRRLASADQCCHKNKSINNFAWLRPYGTELRVGKRAAGVVCAARVEGTC